MAAREQGQTGVSEVVPPTPIPAGNGKAARQMNTSVGDSAVSTRKVRPEPRVPAAAFRPPPPPERDSYAATAFSDIVDRSLHAALARFTAGLSPAALAAAYLDWATHLAGSPGKQMQLIEKSMRKSTRLAHHVGQCALKGGASDACIAPLPQDRRFVGEAWQRWPYSFMYQSFLLQQQWWHNATTGVRGVTRQHENVVEFASRQLLDMVSPSNFLLTNPELLQHTMQQGGMNLVRGAQNFVEDWQRAVSGKKPVGAEAFQVGRNLAVTPGKVIFRNRLIELIQYAPTTDKVRPEPILIVPAWIMKYYILDPSRQNSLVRYLAEQGHTVFMISWKNPDADDRDMTLDDYRKLGVMEALDAISAIVPDQKVHAVGYCLGGTLLSIAAAAMARDGDVRVASLSLLASQVDFTEPGELALFINESQLAFLDSVMWKQGYLDTTQMAGAFQMLRSNDLIWSRIVREYLMGESAQMNDLMAWNADATRMPYRMHSEYLRKLYLNNDLAEGRLKVDGRPVHVSDIRVPIFAVGTVKDHVAPWRSAFKIDMLSDTDVSFALTSGGHNAGIVSEPGHPRRTYRVRHRKAEDLHMDPDTWLNETPEQEGSWWPAWFEWLAVRSGDMASPPSMGRKDRQPFDDAPGTYVFQK